MTERLTKEKAQQDLTEWLKLCSCVWSDTDLSEDESIKVEMAVTVVTKYFSDRFNKTLKK